MWKPMKALLVVAVLWAGGIPPMLVAAEEQSTHRSDTEAAKNTGIAVLGASGALTGAAMGSMVAGPVGGTVGGIVGGAAGAIMAIEGNRRFDRAIKAGRFGGGGSGASCGSAKGESHWSISSAPSLTACW